MNAHQIYTRSYLADLRCVVALDTTGSLILATS